MATHALVALSNTTPTALTPENKHSGMDITVQNVNSSGYIYLGATSSLTSTNYGFRILPNHSISFELPGTDYLYALASTTSMSAAVIKTNLENGS
jgi:hypothetical protein